MRIGLVAGEASGDHLGAELIKAIRDRIPGARFEGVAGPEMRAWVFRRQYPQFSERERGYPLTKRVPGQGDGERPIFPKRSQRARRTKPAGHMA